MPKQKKIVVSYSLDAEVLQAVAELKLKHFLPSDSAVVNMVLSKALLKPDKKNGKTKNHKL